MQKDNNNFCTLYLVRHGETEWNKNEIVMGHMDSPLTENGVGQAKGTAQELKDIAFDAIFSSDSLRAQRTAEIIRLERQIAVQTRITLRERSYGSYEGKTMKEFRDAFKSQLEKIDTLSEQDQLTYKFADDIESNEELVGRFITQLREIGVAYAGKTVLVVSHGGCIRTFLIHADPAKYSVLPSGSFGNAGYVKVLCDGVDFFIKEVKGIKKNS